MLDLVDAELGRDCVLLDVSINNVGPQTDSGGWHLDSPISMMPEPLPDFTLSIQTATMLNDFTAENGATHVVAGSHLTRSRPPAGQDSYPDEVVLEGPPAQLQYGCRKPGIATAATTPTPPAQAWSCSTAVPG